MICRACGTGAPEALCGPCVASLQAGVDRRLPSGLLVRSAFLHQGAARALVHHLKYGGPVAACQLLATAMAGLLPPGAATLVPVPRVLVRTWRYGVDPAGLLAVALSRRTGLPVAGAIWRPWWWAPRAGPAHAVRGQPRFRGRTPLPPGPVLIDDVLTTGSTLSAAHRAVPRAVAAVTATTPAGVPCPPRRAGV